MQVDPQTFVTSQKAAFKWPVMKPLTARPSGPPLTTKHRNFFVQGPVEAYCHCDGHTYDPKLNNYMQLGEKEKLLVKEMTELQEQMAKINNEILDHSCDTDEEKVFTTYQIDYTKRGLPLADYTKLMIAVDDPTPSPVKSQSIHLGHGYRDPTYFRSSCFPRYRVGTCPEVTFCQTPENLITWFEEATGKSEYQDTISRTGLTIIKSKQQYAEPLPSSRRRVGDPCLRI